MSLRWRILGAFMLVILLTVLLSVGIATWSSYRGVNELNEFLSQDEADFLAQQLSDRYSIMQDYDGIDEDLALLGYLPGAPIFFDDAIMGGGIDGFIIDEQGNMIPVDPLDIPDEMMPEEMMPGEMMPEELGILPDEAFFTDFMPSRVVVLDLDDQVIIDNYAEVETGTIFTSEVGKRADIIDFQTSEVVGSVFVEVNLGGFNDGSDSFLSSMLYNTIAGGLITAVIGLILALWLANRVTAPVIALTKATQSVINQATPEALPVTSNDELGQMTTAFNQMISALQTQQELRTRLVSDLSHELNTPLTVMQLEAQGLSDGLQTPSVASQRIMSEISLLKNLVHDLNWLAEADTNDMRLDRKPHFLHDVVNAEVKRWQPQALDGGVEMVVEDSVQPTLVLLDRLRMSQVLGNILRNALQHTPTGGQIRIGSSFEANKFLLIIHDTGCGISADNLPHLFDRFYQVAEDRSREKSGSGLGLAIAQAIVKAHQGDISIASAGLGNGTTVTIRLPHNQ